MIPALGKVCHTKGAKTTSAGVRLVCSSVQNRLVWKRVPSVVVTALPSARIVPDSNGVLGVVDKTWRSVAWAKYYGKGLGYKDAFILQGSQFTLTWQVSDATGAPLDNQPVTLLANKGWSGSNATFTIGNVKVPKTKDGINSGEILGRTDRNGRVSFTLTDTTLQSEPSSTSFTSFDPLIQETGAVYGQFSLHIGKRTDDIQAMDLVDVHIVAVPNADPSMYVANLPIGRMLWSDEFNASAASGIDTATWTARLCSHADSNGGGTCFNDESQYYLPAAVTVDGGSAVITTNHITAPPASGTCLGTVCAFTSGRFDTQGKVAFKYGYLEARIKMPAGAGNWPAFWMLSAAKDDTGRMLPGEIDIIEAGGDRPRRVASAVHFPAELVSGTCCTRYITHSGAHFDGPDFSADFHTFGMAWLPDELHFYVDGKRMFTATNLKAQSRYWAFNQPFFLILNNAVTNQAGYGGAYNGWASTDMRVDYVRQYELAGQGQVSIG